MGSSPKKAARKRAASTVAQPSKRPASSAARASRPRGSGAEETDVGRRIAWYCLHALLIAVPLAMSNATWLGFRLPFTYDQFDIVKVFSMRAITLVAYAGLGWSLLTRGGKVRRTPVDWIVLAFLAWVVLTTVLSIHPPTAVFGKYRRFEGLISFFNYAAVFFLAVQFVDRPSRIRSLARTTFAGAVIVAAYGAMQVLGVDPIDWGARLPFEANRAFSTFGNPDLLGGYLVLVLPLGLALALREEDPAWRAAYWAGFLVVAFTWLTAMVRGAWIGGFVALAIFAFAAWRRREKLQPVDYGFLGAIVLMIAFVVVRSLNETSAVMNIAKRFSTILNFEKGSGLTRTQIWQAAIDAIKDRPLTGFGADTFRLLFPKYKPVEYVEAAGYLSVADNVHNYPLQLATALGIPGFLLLYGTMAFSAVKSAATAFSREDGGERLVLAALWAGCGGYLVHLIAGLSVTGSTFLLWAFVGILLAPTARSVSFERPVWGTYPAVALVGLASVAFVGNLVYITADNYYLKGRAVTSGYERVQAIETAIRLNRYNDMYRAELGLSHQAIFLQSLGMLRNAQQTGAGVETYEPQVRTSLQDAERALLDTIEYVPQEYDNYVFLANLYNIAADNGMGDEWREKAVEIGERGIEVEPYGPAIRLQLATAYLGMGRTEEAVEMIESAVEMDSRYAEGNLTLGGLYAKSGRHDLAAEAYRRALESRNVSPDMRSAAQAGLQAAEASGAVPASD